MTQPSNCFMPECPETSITLVIGADDHDEGIEVGGLCQGHFDSVVQTDDEGRMVFTSRIAHIGIMPSDYQYTEALADPDQL